MFKNVTSEALAHCIADYYSKEMWINGRPDVRFGQHFCNLYLAEGEAWPEVYYEENYLLAIEKIANYIFDNLPKGNKDVY